MNRRVCKEEKNNGTFCINLIHLCWNFLHHSNTFSNSLSLRQKTLLQNEFGLLGVCKSNWHMAFKRRDLIHNRTIFFFCLWKLFHATIKTIYIIRGTRDLSHFVYRMFGQIIILGEGKFGK